MNEIEPIKPIPPIAPIGGRIKKIPRKEVTCPKCGYTWSTRSKLRYVVCPSCLRKFKIND